MHIVLLVKSSSPIVVFCRNNCNPVNGQGVCYHMFEQLPPTSSIVTSVLNENYFNDNIFNLKKKNVSCGFYDFNIKLIRVFGG